MNDMERPEDTREFLAMWNAATKGRLRVTSISVPYTTLHEPTTSSPANQGTPPITWTRTNTALGASTLMAAPYRT